MSDTYRVSYTPEALDDLRDIYAYLAFELRAPDAAKGQVSRIQGQVRSLDIMPKRYEAVAWEPWKSMGMHRVPVDKFIIYYAVDDDAHTVIIIRIFYGGRDVKGIINKGE
ncbi:MAG: type II toxin-antitoxin system RelE/ParE family toxin [Selenomonadaceae bacterium]|nr:type II toxin-antitoxin system RelE/ParE family toxin [Selenomonadaceae bacterium]